MFDVVIAGGLLLTEENNYTAEKVWIGITDGKISEISKTALLPDTAKEWVDAEGCVVMPGMTNAHCHGDMACSMGLGDAMTLAEQNETMEPYNFLFGILTDEDRIWARRKSYLDAVRGGVTYICENMYWSLGMNSVDTLAESGIRGALCEDIRVDFLRPQIFVPDDFLLEFVERCKKADLTPFLGTLSEEDFDTELLKRVYAKRDELGIRNTQHFAETDWREEMVLKKHGMRPVEYLHANGFLSDRMVGSHCVHVNRQEAQWMAEAGVSVANTPLCEMKISDGAAPLAEYVEYGVNVALGTDGAMWNNSSDLFREMKCAVLLQTVSKGPRALNERDALRMATIGGARAFGMDKKTGSINVGKEADIIVIDMTRPHLQPLRTGKHENVASTVVFNATARDVRDVFVKGKAVVRNEKVLCVNEEEIIREANRISEKIAEALPEKFRCYER